MITFHQSLYDQMEMEAEEAYPQECCGLLVGLRESEDKVKVTRVIPSPNMSTDDLTKRFEVDPRLQFELMRHLRDKPEVIVGHYHSHPDHPPLPSETDLKMALDPDMVWVIIGVEQGQAGITKAFSLESDGSAFHSKELRVLP
ncbi:MAG: M67 family metallopeptidase [Alphaproteobacteria bacterium]|nr:M67 family metallopeptidase [Rhodospirillales bacterium]MCW9046141.1 M67 family metallopeptidase [Alphaproteobacteria bacterium]